MALLPLKITFDFYFPFYMLLLNLYGNRLPLKGFATVDIEYE
jgi:hypothetical protein